MSDHTQVAGHSEVVSAMLCGSTFDIVSQQPICLPSMGIKGHCLPQVLSKAVGTFRLGVAVGH